MTLKAEWDVQLLLRSGCQMGNQIVSVRRNMFVLKSSFRNDLSILNSFINLKLQCVTLCPLAVKKLKLHASLTCFACASALLCMDVISGTETLKSTLNKLNKHSNLKKVSPSCCFDLLQTLMFLNELCNSLGLHYTAYTRIASLISNMN